MKPKTGGLFAELKAPDRRAGLRRFITIRDSQPSTLSYSMTCVIAVTERGETRDVPSDTSMCADRPNRNDELNLDAESKRRIEEALGRPLTQEERRMFAIAEKVCGKFVDLNPHS